MFTVALIGWIAYIGGCCVVASQMEVESPAPPDWKPAGEGWTWHLHQWERGVYDHWEIWERTQSGWEYRERMN